jgi:hypothetical protein
MSRRTLLICLVLAALSVGPAAWSAQLGFLRFTPAFYFTDADWELATTQFQAFVATQPVGAEDGGDNPDTGAAWRFRILAASEEDGQPCRQVAITLDARQVSHPGQSAFLFCRQPDDAWRMIRGLH